MTDDATTYSLDDILHHVKAIWGYDQLRPLQEVAIRAELEGRDSLVVLPTGGGKSLCYQVPPLVAGRTDLVISPLISLMKDQVDGLRANGYPAVALNSALTADERRQAEDELESGNVRLVFMSPERALTGWVRSQGRRLGIQHIAVDEAHCISHWGHDFRPEYRQLAQLKADMGVSIHAYTATATERVRADIIAQLNLQDPAVHVGNFDRPNLVYRVLTRSEAKKQIFEVIDRHRNEAVIIYCMSRADTERIAGHLNSAGYTARFYHAGMNPTERREAQEAFVNEEIDIVVATVAFGMGIDRSNVRCVIHAAMPQSIEHYQQEAGRAGRDGLEAECVLLYSPADTLRWRSLMEKRAGGDEGSIRAVDLELLSHMRRYSSPTGCRHRALVEYFGQAFESDNCGACDICLGEVDDLIEGTREAQMILSCVARVEQRFGMGHVVDVLRGADSPRIKKMRHDQLSTYGLLTGTPKKTVTNWVFQLLDQDLLTRTNGDYPLLRLNAQSMEVLRGQRQVFLMPTKTKRVKKTTVEAESWDGVSRDLFEALRTLRSTLARERGVPPYVIFNDATLRDMARRRPKTLDEMLQVQGVGKKKVEDLGPTFLEAVLNFSG
ncbi:MAG: DNA helicase RecQ [Rhodothermales bacterium]